MPLYPSFPDIQTVAVTGSVVTTAIQSGSYTVIVSGTQTITGAVGVSGPVTVNGSVTSVITGTVQTSVTSLPNITGSVNVTNAFFPVTGTIALDRGNSGANPLFITGSVNVIPPAVQAVTGTVAIVQPITVQGTVTSVITGTVQTAVQSLPNITGSVNVTNSLFNVTGSVGVNNTVRVTGSLAVDNVVRITTTGSLPVTANISVSGSTISSTNPLPVTQASSAFATFTVMALTTAIGNNKSMLSIYNPVGSGIKLKLREFYIRNPQTTAITGIAADFRVYRFSSVSAPAAGTTLTPVAHDTDDTIAVGVSCKTGATISGEEATPLDRMVMSTDDWGPGTLDVEANQQAIANYLPARAKRDPQLKALTANPGQGLHMKHVVNSTAGNLDIIFVFTQEST